MPRRMIKPNAAAALGAAVNSNFLPPDWLTQPNGAICVVPADRPVITSEHRRHRLSRRPAERDARPFHRALLARVSDHVPHFAPAFVPVAAATSAPPPRSVQRFTQIRPPRAFRNDSAVPPDTVMTEATGSGAAAAPRAGRNRRFSAPAPRSTQPSAADRGALSCNRRARGAEQPAAVNKCQERCRPFARAETAAGREPVPELPRMAHSTGVVWSTDGYVSARTRGCVCPQNGRAIVAAISLSYGPHLRTHGPVFHGTRADRKTSHTAAQSTPHQAAVRSFPACVQESMSVVAHRSHVPFFQRMHSHETAQP